MSLEPASRPLSPAAVSTFGQVKERPVNITGADVLTVS